VPSLLPRALLRHCRCLAVSRVASPFLFDPLFLPSHSALGPVAPGARRSILRRGHGHFVPIAVVFLPVILSSGRRWPFALSCVKIQAGALVAGRPQNRRDGRRPRHGGVKLEETFHCLLLVSVSALLCLPSRCRRVAASRPVFLPFAPPFSHSTSPLPTCCSLTPRHPVTLTHARRPRSRRRCVRVTVVQWAAAVCPSLCQWLRE